LALFSYVFSLFIKVWNKTMLENRKKIILVDDDPTNLRVAKKILMDQYDVFTVPSAEKLFRFLEKTLPDLILLDVMMPEANGYDVIRILKKNQDLEDVPVIFLTSKSDSESELLGFSLGAVDYISKPFSPPLLLKRIETHLQFESQKQALKNWNENLQQMVDEKAGLVLEMQGAVLRTISNLVEYRDDVTGGHIERTEKYLRFLVEELMTHDVYVPILENWDMDLFFQSAQLHDVGKIAIRDNILLKQGKLTEDEFDEMKKHAAFGEMVIEKIQQNTRESVFLTHAKIMAGTHHEKWDGSGYPRGLSGSQIPLQGRMMALADVFDALISERPYKQPFSYEEAIQIIKDDAGRHFDPVLAELFVNASAHFIS
jgi:putative two-component system response regulator